MWSTVSSPHFSLSKKNWDSEPLVQDVCVGNNYILYKLYIHLFDELAKFVFTGCQHQQCQHSAYIHYDPAESDGIGKSGALIVRYSQKKEFLFFSIVLRILQYCLWLWNHGGPILVQFSAKCMSTQIKLNNFYVH